MYTPKWLGILTMITLIIVVCRNLCLIREKRFYQQVCKEVNNLCDSALEKLRDSNKLSRDIIADWAKYEKAVHINCKLEETRVRNILTEIAKVTGIDIVELPSFGTVYLNQQKAASETRRDIEIDNEDPNAHTHIFYFDDWDDVSGLVDE